MSERRQNNDSPSWSEGLPIWVRAVALVGVPSAIAIFLVWMGASDLPKIRSEIEQVHREVLFNREILNQQNLKSDAQLRLLRWICSNTAKDDQARQKCFD